MLVSDIDLCGCKEQADGPADREEDGCHQLLPEIPLSLGNNWKHKPNFNINIHKARWLMLTREKASLI